MMRYLAQDSHRANRDFIRDCGFKQLAQSVRLARGQELQEAYGATTPCLKLRRCGVTTRLLATDIREH